MVEQDRGMKSPFTLLRSSVALVWVVLSTILYASATMLASLVSRSLMLRIQHAWCSHLLAVAGVRVSCRGIDNLPASGSVVIVSNHQSHIDIPVLFAALRRPLTFVAKKELFGIPVFGWAIKLVGHLEIDRGSARKARESFNRAVTRMREEDLAVIVFPEGTRSIGGKLGGFKRGSFSLAVESNVPVIPVAVRGSGLLLPKKSLLIRPGVVHVEIGEPVAPGDASAAGKEHLCAVSRDRISRALESVDSRDD